MKRVFALLLACLLLTGIGAAYEGDSPGNDDEPPGWLNIQPKEEPAEDAPSASPEEQEERSDDEPPGWLNIQPGAVRRRTPWLAEYPAQGEGGERSGGGGAPAGGGHGL